MWETEIFYKTHPSAGFDYRLSTRGYDPRNFCYKFLTEQKLQGKSHEEKEILLSERKVINRIFPLALELPIPAVLYEEYLTIGHYLRL
jgi:hypothetical protein